MGKRKRRADHNKTPNPPFDKIPPSSQIDSFSEQRCSANQAYDNEARPSSSNMDSADDLVLVSQGQSLPSHQHASCSRGIVLKHPRHHYSRHYYRKRRSNHGETSNFTGKVTHQQGEKLSFKLSSKPYPDSSFRIAENREKLLFRPEKIRDSLLTNDGASSDVVCGLCEKLLRKKPFVLDHSTSSGELSVVAVLVCGHVYHADCLEKGTSHEDRNDPPCPLCACTERANNDASHSLEHE